ncbi:MAG: antibiotic biosynthesis monooxygenase [Desulfofustis sp. PB-SRB1]|jgi:quinol monooxygenase YgiN|nr:antibiotic biosynthesis monooxygenase [Desulfofustis sp. PB-SRB1]MBM1003979.1 antibiotic biosynthesis monooxygenase [Desulfofustis sp. PB-SRB1]HBH28568.1 hypothetical protein [Desulfofustis sp.]
MIIHLLHLEVPPRDRSDAIKTIQAAIGPTRARRPCLSCHLFAHVDNDDELLLMQKWDSQAELDTYLNSPTYGLLIEVLELALERPAVEFHIISGSFGMEHIEAVRHPVPI